MLVLQGVNATIPYPNPWGEGAPGYARIFGLTLGANSMRGLIRALGEGVVRDTRPPAPPDTAREWRRRGTFIWADGSPRGEFLAWTRLEIDGWEGRLDELPQIGLWSGTLAPLKNGMRLSSVQGHLGKGWLVERGNFLTRRDRRRVVTRVGPMTLNYRIGLGFENGGLKTLSLTAERSEFVPPATVAVAIRRQG